MIIPVPHHSPPFQINSPRVLRCLIIWNVVFWTWKKFALISVSRNGSKLIFGGSRNQSGMKKRKSIYYSYTGSGISCIKKKKRLCKSHFNTSNYMDCELFQWGFLSQRYSFIRVSYIWQDLWYGSACERVEWMRKITNFSSLTKKEDGINS